MIAGFFDRLAAAIERSGSRLCVGLDPHLGGVPAEELAAFNRRLIEATAEFACCYKPNIAFYEARGEAGMRALRETLAAVPPDLPVILDAKRGDIGSTAEAYAAALFDDLGADAATVNPYLGHDALAPFLQRDDRGVYILCRTSNPGAADLQDLHVETASGERLPLYLVVADYARQWNARGNIGVVVGATYPRELAAIRIRCPELPLLIPGVGVQGGALEEVVETAENGKPAGFVVSVSRAIVEAARPGEDPFVAARAAARRYRDAIAAAARARR